jgi:23S rRNA-/tRNA-specific pseudouridylate synthase
MPDITTADKVPPVILESIYSSERERTEKLKSLVMSHPEQIDSEQDMARIKLYVEEDLLCVKMIDHLLDGVYLIGKENAYYKDLSQTSQKRPEYFARVFVGELIPLNGIKDDKYTIYYNLNNKLYRTDNWIQIRKVEKNEK